MEAYILDKQYQILDVVDAFDSFIWTERYLGFGDFELRIPTGIGISPYLEQDNYMAIKESDVTMIIESIEITTDIEQGSFCTITGRSLESVLERRIVWNQETLTGNLQDNILGLLNRNVIAPAITERTISGFRYQASTDDTITSLEIEVQLFGETMYDVLYAFCEVNGLGFKIISQPPVTNDLDGGFLLSLYRGVDRSYNQDLIPWVVFSPKFENLLNTQYLHTTVGFKNSTLVAGEGEGAEQKVYEVTPNNDSGLDRRETFTSSSASSSARDDQDNEYTLTPEEYNALLETDGLTALMETIITEAFEGEISAHQQFIYGKDFFLGDLVHVVNEYGMEATSRVSEVIRTHNLEGETIYPTFTAFETGF